jgi:predicted DNA-binding protein
MLPERGVELGQTLTFRLSDQDMRRIVNYADSIQAPVSYAIRTLIRKSLTEMTDRQAATGETI